MKRLKNFFKMMVTAVICFFVGILPKKREAEKCIAGSGYINGDFSGQRGWGKSKYNETLGKSYKPFRMSTVCRRENIRECRYKRPKINKKFFWLKGPGDRTCMNLLTRRMTGNIINEKPG